MKNLLRVAVALGLLALAFVWGYLSRRNKIFPHPQMEAVAQQMGWISTHSENVTNVRSASPALAALDTLGYVDGTIDSNLEASGVILNEPAATFPGFNLYHAYERRSAYLLDMDGEAVHRWEYPAGYLRRDSHLELTPEGDLFVRMKYGLSKIDAASQLVWAYATGEGRELHHDFELAPSGEIYVLALEGRVIPEIHPTLETVDDSVRVLSPDGVETGAFSLVDAMLASPYRFLLPAISHLDLEMRAADSGAVLDLDVLHTNHIEIFGGPLADRLAERSPIYAAGNLLVSMRNINSIAILDGTTREVLWLWGPSNLTFQHHPTLLENGNILIFNNGLERSTVLELDPLSRQVVWQYGPVEDFFTELRGSAQRLPNGNTLISESDAGYVHEVTPGGEVVWRFANPEVDVATGTRFTVWRMQRYGVDKLGFLGR